MATRGAAGWPGSELRGANPDRLVPIITTPGALGQPLATGSQIGTLCALSAQEMEPRPHMRARVAHDGQILIRINDNPLMTVERIKQCCV